MEKEFIKKNNLEQFMVIIPSGEWKGKRLYNELYVGNETIIPIEFYFLFINAIKNDLNVFHIINTPTHNIKIPENDLIFLKKEFTSNMGHIYDEYNFSQNTKLLKEFQYHDLLKLYNLSIKTKNILSLFLYPYFNTNLYCYNMFVIVNNKFNLNEILNLNFKGIKIHSFNKLDNNNLNLEFLKNIYDFKNIQFKNYIITPKEWKIIKPYSIMKLKEKQNLDNFMQLNINHISHNKNNIFDYSEFNKKELKLKNILYEKEAQLTNLNYYKKVIFKKFCFHYYIFDEIILEDTLFFTNFYELTGGGPVQKTNNKFEIDFNNLCPYCIEDSFGYGDFELFSLFIPVYQFRYK